MKKFSIILWIILPFYINAQIVTDKTNILVLDYSKEDTNTILPEIIWESPRTEYSHTNESSVNVEATVNSVTPLKKVRFSERESGVLSTNDGNLREINIKIIASANKSNVLYVKSSFILVPKSAILFVWNKTGKVTKSL